MNRTKPSSASVSDIVREEYALLLSEQLGIVRDFVNLYRHPASAEADKCLTAFLARFFGTSMSRPMKFLLDNVDETVRRRFAYTYLAPGTLASLATVSVVVRPTRPGERMTPNAGCFLVCLRTLGGEEVRLRFVNQISAVYYIMYLIDRRRKGTASLPHLSLSKNRETLMGLYHAVYDNILHDDVRRRVQALIFRDSGGRFLKGRESQVISDIRHAVAKVFDSLDESFMPYAMTTSSHLALMPDKITFEDSARRLLYFDFLS